MRIAKIFSAFFLSLILASAGYADVVGARPEPHIRQSEEEAKKKFRAREQVELAPQNQGPPDGGPKAATPMKSPPQMSSPAGTASQAAPTPSATADARQAFGRAFQMLSGQPEGQRTEILRSVFFENLNGANANALRQACATIR